jgi:hypothetical protein
VTTGDETGVTKAAEAEHVQPVTGAELRLPQAASLELRPGVDQHDRQTDLGIPELAIPLGDGELDEAVGLDEFAGVVALCRGDEHVVGVDLGVRARERQEVGGPAASLPFDRQHADARPRGCLRQ